MNECQAPKTSTVTRCSVLEVQQITTWTVFFRVRLGRRARAQGSRCRRLRCRPRRRRVAIDDEERCDGDHGVRRRRVEARGNVDVFFDDELSGYSTSIFAISNSRGRKEACRTSLTCCRTVIVSAELILGFFVSGVLVYEYNKILTRKVRRVVTEQRTHRMKPHPRCSPRSLTGRRWSPPSRRT